MVIKTGYTRIWLLSLFKTEPSWKQWHCLAINGPFSSHGVVTRLNFRWQILQCVAFKNWFTLINDSGKPVIIMPICPRSILKPGFYKSSMFSLQHKVCKCPSLCDDHCCRWQTRLFTHHTQFVQIFGVVSEKLMPGRALDLETNRNWRRLLHCMC